MAEEITKDTELTDEVAKKRKKGEIKMAEEITKDTEPTDEVVKTVPYERFKAVNEERNTFKTSLAEKNNKINALIEKLKAYEGYIPPAELEKVKTETEKSYQEKMEALTIQSKLETKLVAEGIDAEFTEFIMSKADTVGLKLKDEKVVGLDNVVNGLKEKYPKMFGVKQTKPVGVPPAGAGGKAPAATDEEAEIRKRVFAAAGLKI